MTNPSQVSYQLALRDFQRARNQAVMQQLLARFRGDGSSLLPFDEVTEQLHSTGESVEHGLQEIPLDKIVGSVARYKDFTRDFLPKRDTDEERWAGVRAAVTDMVGIPPILVYQIGDAYFVQDGNHRVSIARHLNSGTIGAYVTEIKTRVSFSADDDPNEIICKAHYADFLELTNLDRLCPDADLSTTFCGRYKVLLDQIKAGINRRDNGRLLPYESDQWEQAVIDWYDDVYIPVIHIIRELGVLHRFPERTEADMYLLLSERRDDLEEELGWQVEIETGVSDLLTAPEEPQGLLERVVKTISPDPASAPVPGLWRQQQLARRRYHHLFKDILVPLDGTDAGWEAFDYIARAAKLDQDHILGLHVVPSEDALGTESVLEIQERFEQGLREAGIQGEFAVEVDSKPIRVLIKRSAWVDCLIISKNRPPEDPQLAPMSPNLKTLIQQCPRPFQVRPAGSQRRHTHGLLAYDGSPKADEALFVATYFTARWLKSLTVVTVETAYTSAAAQERARKYLIQHGLTDVTYVLQKGRITEAVLETATAYNSDLLFLGAFSFRSPRQLALGSSAERIITEYPNPMWICR